MMVATAQLAAEDDAAGFWHAAQDFAARGLPPEGVLFSVAGRAGDLFADAHPPAEPAAAAEAPTRAGAIADLLDPVLLHAAHDRFALAYRLLWRSRTEPRTLSILSDPDVARARDMAKSVRRDMHKMTAFVRFRETAAADGEPVFVAWFEPQHHIVRATAPFFARRFAGMRWSILTPGRSAHWDGARLTFSAGARREATPKGDPLESVWRTYYASIFNPARLNPKAMQAHMPKKYWRNLPEAELIGTLVAEAPARSAAMVAAAPTVPRRATRKSPTQRPAAGTVGSCGGDPDSLATCTRCDLYRHATQAVPGEGPPRARLMIVGEQPGDQEDLTGRPFVGPAGRVLDTALERSGIARAESYVTNAVKHFKFEPRGKVRLHKSPSRSEIDHCRWWLDKERASVRPQLIVALGATAIRGLTGASTPVKDLRSMIIALEDGAHMLTTVHPSYLLRLREEADKRREWTAFLADWRLARSWLDAHPVAA